MLKKMIIIVGLICFSNTVLAIDSVKQGGANADCPEFFPMGIPQTNNQKVQRRVFHVCHDGYSSLVDPASKTPLWVVHRLKGDEMFGNEPRSNDFEPDPLLPKAVQATRSDYLRSGFDMGHLAPAKDFSASGAKIMDQSFFFSNIIPQDPENNRKGWMNLESFVRNWAYQAKDLVVITGPIYANGSAKQLVGRSGVAAPTHIFKIVYIPSTGNSLSFIVPNEPIISKSNSKADWQRALAEYIVKTEQIEQLTGFKFFINKPVLDNMKMWPVVSTK